VWDVGFTRAYRKKVANSKKLKKKFEDSLSLFVINPFNPKLRTHKLSGPLEGSWSFYVDYDCRCIFDFVDDNTALLIDFGSHDEVY
jgi:mRNA-degrading endonuclease YafQ of YafQ-DinJ toxin-antitoxin module